jgi:hypothetical protein
VFSLFGTLAFAIFSFYLIWCVLKGAMKFGLRLLIITIHPLKCVAPYSVKGVLSINQATDDEGPGSVAR